MIWSTLKPFQCWKAVDSILPMTIPVVFTHEDFVVINKPCDISVQLEQGHDYADALLNQVCLQLGVPKLWLVHRLDKLTSGLLILAKKPQAAAALSQMFERREISKYYLALSNKKPKKKQGAVCGDMKKVRDGKWMLLKQQQNPALSQFFSLGLGDGLRLFIVRPHTGKTHQIRVALKSIGSPILGDTLYGGDKADRGYLHAFSLNFSYQNRSISISQSANTGEYFGLQACVDGIDSYDPPSELEWPTVKGHLSRSEIPF